MNAETILKLIERAREPLLKEAHIKAYAQAMIEKDRESVENTSYEYFSGEVTAWQLHQETPIILD
jgi:hypothetical protein